MAEYNENELISKAKNRNQAAFKSLVDAHKEKALRIAWRYTNNLDDAEDIVQDAFIQAYRTLENYRGDSSFSTWFYRIIVNLSLNAIKKKKRYIFTDLEENMVIDKIADEKNEMASNLIPFVKKSLIKLPEGQRIVFSMRHFEQLSTRQVSEVLKISEGSVKKQLHRAIQFLRKSITKNYPEFWEAK